MVLLALKTQYHKIIRISKYEINKYRISKYKIDKYKFLAVLKKVISITI